MFVTFDPSWRCRHHQSVCQQQHESHAGLRPAGGPEGTRVRRQVDSDPSPAAELEPEHVLPRTLLDALWRLARVQPTSDPRLRKLHAGGVWQDWVETADQRLPAAGDRWAIRLPVFVIASHPAERNTLQRLKTKEGGTQSTTLLLSYVYKYVHMYMSLHQAVHIIRVRYISTMQYFQSNFIYRAD